ncbi:YwqH-like family protein [Peribacillus asahii]|uniref:YwqH-like family protein n=1 Tax=Peribacillus asahii TaxID=228899 RepID=UPI00207A2A32|nr:DUF5082 family protein [Peribacillus asahii]USK58761.1 DUF5082 domain-containing protein [Peribacillus asahii]
MSFSGALNQIYNEISSQSAAIDEKISRLVQAKRKIKQEQNLSLQEIPKILEPQLGDSWKGSRSDSFDKFREKAHTGMVTIINDEYDDYVQSIENKINLLQIERSVLDFTSGLANEASQLIGKGEEVFAELESKINDLKGRLF